ncbi:MarR family transcriptional regulator [Planotetraspora sp. A-T 1434]|uniref:MarR family winged helix-turn-helix transcriptional regulator n=1 Tax=Planotetraspora sp. A-T 1434 TaxID=2979219 RepID=UPI0021C0089A|nr:MarR family transcriptional regulator [Planotetraspora sp. A-T 1434]MCT9933756.1 MarR family transcriptional regulator [Planotetraspora sp. A-T 1434]
MTEDTPRRRGRQLPSAEELRIWRDFIETAEALRSELASRLQSESSLSPGDYVVLLALSESQGQRMRSSELAAHIGWERSRLSHHLARMERRGLIRREECATDNRGAEVVLTPTGAKAFGRATVPHLRAVRELFVDTLTPDQLLAAGELAATLRTRLRSSRRVDAAIRDLPDGGHGDLDTEDA